jgi:crotonobetainyl-CoA:carnitine CoA-transferase CaiB-like acyl-CoA transferase
VVQRIAEGSSLDAALTAVVDRVRQSESEAVKFLSQAGVTVQEARTWAEYFGTEPSSRADIEAAFENSDVDAMLDRFQRFGVISEHVAALGDQDSETLYALDRLIAEAGRISS